MLGPILTGIIFSAIVILLCIFKPEAGRCFLGFFFLLMALGINIPYIITQPYFVYQYGMSSQFPLYRDLTESIIGLNPILFGVLLIVFEVTVGLSLLGRRNWVKAGLLLSSLFILLLVPIQYPQIAWALCVPVVLKRMKREYERNVIELIRDWKVKKETGQNSL